MNYYYYYYFSIFEDLTSKDKMIQYFYDRDTFIRKDLVLTNFTLAQ